MKILHTNFLHGWGGQSNRIFIVCKGLLEKGVEVHLSAPDDSVLIEKSSHTDIKILHGLSYASGIRLHKIIPDVLKLRKYIIENKIDIVHLHGSQDSWVGAFACVGLHNVIVLRTKHNIFPMNDNFMNQLLYGKMIDGYVAISQAIKKQIKEKKYIKNKPIAVIHSAVDMDQFENISDEDVIKFKNDFGITRNNFLIGAVGRLRSEKGFEYLIKSIPNVVRKFPNVKFMIVGSGSLDADLKQLAKNTGVEDYIIFTGFRKDVPVVLKAFDLFVMPSISEGLGTAVLEAMACGKTIIASNIGGIPDSIKHEETGILIPSATPSEISNAIISLMNNPNLAARLSINAKNFVKENFTIENLVNGNYEFYKKLSRREKKTQREN